MTGDIAVQDSAMNHTSHSTSRLCRNPCDATDSDVTATLHTNHAIHPSREEGEIRMPIRHEVSESNIFRVGNDAAQDASLPIRAVPHDIRERAYTSYALDGSEHIFDAHDGTRACSGAPIESNASYSPGTHSKRTAMYSSTAFPDLHSSGRGIPRRLTLQQQPHWPMSERSGMEDLHDTLRRTQPRLLQRAIREHTVDSVRHNSHTAPARTCVHAYSSAPSRESAEGAQRQSVSDTEPQQHDEDWVLHHHRPRGARTHPVLSSVPCANSEGSDEGGDEVNYVTEPSASHAVRIATTPVHARVTAALVNLRSRQQDANHSVTVRSRFDEHHVHSEPAWLSAHTSVTAHPRSYGYRASLSPSSHCAPACLLSASQARQPAAAAVLTMPALELLFGKWCVWSQHMDLSNCSAISRCSSIARQNTTSTAGSTCLPSSHEPNGGRRVPRRRTSVVDTPMRRLASCQGVVGMQAPIPRKDDGFVMGSNRIGKHSTNGRSYTKTSGNMFNMTCSGMENEGDGARQSRVHTMLRKQNRAPPRCYPYVTDDMKAACRNHVQHWCDRVLIARPSSIASAGSAHTPHAATESCAENRDDSMPSRVGCVSEEYSCYEPYADDMADVVAGTHSAQANIETQGVHAHAALRAESTVHSSGEDVDARADVVVLRSQADKAPGVTCATPKRGTIHRREYDHNENASAYNSSVQVTQGQELCTLTTHRTMCARFHPWGEEGHGG